MMKRSSTISRRRILATLGSASTVGCSNIVSASSPDNSESVSVTELAVTWEFSSDIPSSAITTSVDTWPGYYIKQNSILKIRESMSNQHLNKLLENNDVILSDTFNKRGTSVGLPTGNEQIFATEITENYRPIRGIVAESFPSLPSITTDEEGTDIRLAVGERSRTVSPNSEIQIQMNSQSGSILVKDGDPKQPTLNESYVYIQPTIHAKRRTSLEIEMPDQERK